ncbi:MAG: flavin reductase family protein [Promethearchaeota archaeon]|nr:MAG: flavin reductase family protein [Candidatus Lokiarchaeota archaeon]
MSKNRIEIGSYDYMNYFMEKAALLVSVDKNDKPNVMALLWKQIGELWMIPVITVAVAPTRYTFECLKEGQPEFTINIPSENNEHTIDIAGSCSGRNTDKFEKAELEIIEGKKTKVPTIKDCVLSYECKIVHECKSGSMASHSLFFGKILAAYASNEIIK